MSVSSLCRSTGIFRISDALPRWGIMTEYKLVQLVSFSVVVASDIPAYVGFLEKSSVSPKGRPGKSSEIRSVYPRTLTRLQNTTSNSVRDSAIARIRQEVRTRSDEGPNGDDEKTDRPNRQAATLY